MQSIFRCRKIHKASKKKVMKYTNLNHNFQVMDSYSSWCSQFLCFVKMPDSSEKFPPVFLNLDHKNKNKLCQNLSNPLWSYEKNANQNIITCASNSDILCKDACSMEVRRLHSSSSKPVIWYLSSAISWARSSASSLAFNFSSFNSS